MKSSSADRLRRLRWWLTLVFTVMNAVGLIVFAWLVVREDGMQGELQLDAELRRVSSTVTRLLQYDDERGELNAALVGQDELARQCPQFAVLPGGDEAFRGYLSEHRCVDVDAARLGGVARQSAQSGALVTGYVRGTRGELVRVGAEPFRNPDGKFIGAVVAAVDATGEHERHDRLALMVIGGCVLLIVAVAGAGYVVAGRAIRPAADALEQQEKLLAETAHDLRTPVAALRALAETAERNPDQRAELLPRTVRLAGRMGGIIDGLLVRARLAAGVEVLAIQPIWLDQLVTSVVDETPTDDGAKVTVSAAPTKVLADPGLMQRAIGNLLDNALRHGRSPGVPARVHVFVAGGRVTVADNGPGIDSSVAERSLGQSGGNGLGLSIVRWVAQAHGGMLRVFNADEGGAIFELELPVIS